MKKNMLHSNLLGRFSNGLLKFFVLVVLVCGWGSAFGAVNWNTSGTYTGPESIPYYKEYEIPDGVEIKIEGDLTIENKGGLSTSSGKLTIHGSLYVTGSLTLDKYSELEIVDGILIVGGNFNQNAGVLSISVASVNATGSLIVIAGDYKVEKGGFSLTEVDKLEPSSNGNEVYVFGSSAVEGVSKGDAFYSTHESLETAFLPIELTSFTATATEYGYTFNWVTASEKNNDYFTLEYSINGVDFNEIDYVHGAGTTSETSEYEYRWDEAPNFEMMYFRLKQTDYNGEYTYSDVIVSCRKKSAGATRTFRYGPLNLQVVDGELRYIENK